MLKRPPRQRADRGKLSGKGLRAEAVALVRARPGVWTLRALSQHLGRQYRLPPNLVRDLLEQGPELRRPPQQLPSHASHRPVMPTPTPTPIRSWDRVVEDLTWWLSETDTYGVHVEVPASATARLDLRYDFVRTGVGLQVWLAAIARSPELLQAYLTTGPWTLTEPGRLPLVSALPDLVAPAVVVWRHATPKAAALALHEVLGETLALPVDRVRLHRQQCTPAELERRLGDEATIRRLGGRAGRKRPAVSQCDRCGQPLSDPVSVQLGIGPECRKHYSKEVIRRLRSPGQTFPRPGSIREKEWLATVEPWLRGTIDAPPTDDG